MLSITFNEDVVVIVCSDCSGNGMAAVAMTMTTSQCFGSLRDDRLCAFNWTNLLVPSFASCISYPILSCLLFTVVIAIAIDLTLRSKVEAACGAQKQLKIDHPTSCNLLRNELTKPLADLSSAPLMVRKR